MKIEYTEYTSDDVKVTSGIATAGAVVAKYDLSDDQRLLVGDLEVGQSLILDAGNDRVRVKRMA